MKICKKCKKQKDESAFSFRGHGRRRNTCKDCCSKRDKQYYMTKKSELETLVNDILAVARFDQIRLANLTKSSSDRFSKVSFDEFEKARQDAFLALAKKGALSKESVEFSDGTYLVVGESRGKNTKREMFALLEILDAGLEVDKIIHVGSAIDDDYDISNLWANFKGKVTFVAKSEELPYLHNKKNNFGVDIVTGSVKLGDVYCKNQTEISAYTKQSISSLDSSIFKNSSIVNSTRLEYFQRNDSLNNLFIASTGTISEPHVAKRITNNPTFSYFNSSKFDRMNSATEFWKQGLVIVEVKNNKAFVYPIRIEKDGSNYCTCFDNRFFHSDSITNCDSVEIIVADIHAPRYEAGTMSMLDGFMRSQSNISKITMLGDTSDCRSLNRHILDKKQQTDGDLLAEFASIENLVLFFMKYSSDVVFMLGNHEKWMFDFANRYNGLKNLFDYLYKKSLHGVKDVRDTVYFENAEDVVYMHGSDQVFGSSGSVNEKYSKAFPKAKLIVTGHTHSPTILRNVVNVGCLCKYDQDYNQPNLSNWKRGILAIYRKGDLVFPVNLLFNVDENGNDYCLYNGKLYEAPKAK